MTGHPLRVYIGRPYLRKIKGRKEERSMRKRGKREEDKKKMKIRKKKKDVQRGTCYTTLREPLSFSLTSNSVVLGLWGEMQGVGLNTCATSVLRNSSCADEFKQMPYFLSSNKLRLPGFVLKCLIYLELFGSGWEKRVDFHSSTCNYPIWQGAFVGKMLCLFSDIYNV